MDIQTAYNNLFNKYYGIGNVGDTPENKGQCVGLIEVFTDSLGLPHTWGNAYQLLDDADKNFFEIILNTPLVVPIKGDIPVWSKDFNHTNGHTGVATGNSDINKFDCLVQNDPLGSTCHVKTYNYNYVVGWLRPKLPQEPVPTPQPPSTPDVTESDALNAISVLKTWKDKYAIGGNLEGWANLLCQDAYPVYKNPPQPTNQPINDSLWEAIKKFFGR